MTSKALQNNGFKLFNYSVFKTMGITVLISVFTLLICPGYLLININKSKTVYAGSVFSFFDFSRDIPKYIVVICILTTLSALLYLFVNWSFLYSRNASDYFHSLPIKRSKLLTARFSASLVPVLIPLVLSYGAMALISLFAVNDGDIKLVLIGLVFNILIIITCAAFSLLFIICSGNVFDLLVSFATFNVGMLVLRYIGIELCDSLLLGFSSVDEFEFFMSSSPLFYGFAALYGILTGEVFANQTVWETVFNLFITAAVSLIASYLLYNGRKSESSEISYAYKFIYYICTVTAGIIGAYLLGSLFSDDTKKSPLFWIFALLGGVLATVTFTAVNERNFKNVKRSVVMGGSAFLILAVSAVVLYSGGFGYTKHIPDKKDIKSVSVGFYKLSAEFDNPSLALEFHKELIKDEFSEQYDYVSLNYTLKNGKHLSRSFYIDFNDYKDIMLKIYKSEEHIKAIEKNLGNFSSKDISTSLSLEYADEYLGEVYITSDELEEIKKAYISDIPKATHNSIDTSEKVYIKCNLQGYDQKGRYVYEQLYIEKSFENTLSVLKGMNLKERSEPIKK